MRYHKILSVIAVYVCLVLMPGFFGHASSVRHVTMDEMLDQCQLVFEGDVLAVESIQTDPKRIHTRVTFGIRDIVKGVYPANTITLRFLGGTIGQMTLAVSDMKFPRAGERGIYFVESLERMQVHPLYGWSQGHFVVKPDETGTDRVMTSFKQPVTAISRRQMDAGQEPGLSFSRGVARGVVIEMKDADIKGLTADEFKKTLRDIMAGGQ